MIDIDYLKKLLELFDESSVNDLKIEKEGTAIRLTKNPRKETAESAPYHFVSPAPVSPLTVSPPGGINGNESERTSPQAKEEKKEEEKGTSESLHEIRSPIVGTFYSSPSPDADPYVLVGSDVQPGETLCIIEAMKLMNEIESDVSGRVAKVLVENAQPVEYGQVLFLIEK